MPALSSPEPDPTAAGRERGPPLREEGRPPFPSRPPDKAACLHRQVAVP